MPELRFAADFSSEVDLVVSEDVIAAFADLSGDFSSLHVDEKFARSTIFRKRVAHGVLPVVFLPACPGLVPEGATARLAEISAHFSGPVFVGDRVGVRVSLVAEHGDSSTAEFSYRIENMTRDEAVARGRFVLGFSGKQRSQSDQADTEARGNCMLDAALDEQNLDISDISKGDSVEIKFSIGQVELAAYRALLAAGKAAVSKNSDERPALELKGLLAACSVSPLVGMCIPGRAATLVEFSLVLDSVIESSSEYLLAAEVAHLSRGARLVKMHVAVAATGHAGDVMSGTVSALVNEQAASSQAVLDLEDLAMDMGLAGKVVIVTGASGSIGSMIARLFAMRGSAVVVNYRRSADEANRIVAEIEAAGGRALAVGADVSEESEVVALIDRAVEVFGGVDVLVNNAVRDFRPVAYDKLTWEEMQLDIDVTLKGAFLCSKAVVPRMLARGGGKIVNVSSVFAMEPPRDQLKYAVSKAALEGLSRALAAEFIDQNIQVNCVVPSFVDTEVASRLHAGISRKRAQDAPSHRNALPQEVAQAVLFLASGQATYTTGQRLLVTGGAPFL